VRDAAGQAADGLELVRFAYARFQLTLLRDVERRPQAGARSSGPVWDVVDEERPVVGLLRREVAAREKTADRASQLPRLPG
jgi:hypothetical protein